MLNAVLDNDPRPFFMHQSNLAGDRLAYTVMDAVLSAYRAVYGASAPILNLPDVGGRRGPARPAAVGHGPAREPGHRVGRRATRSRSPARRARTVPVTVPAGTTAGAAARPSASPYAGELSGYTTLGARPLTLTCLGLGGTVRGVTPGWSA